MTDQGAFNFRCTKPVACHIEDVIDTAYDPKIAIFIASRAVAGEIIDLKFDPVLLPITGLIAVNGGQHRWPGAENEKLTTYGCSDFVPFHINHNWSDATEWQRG